MGRFIAMSAALVLSIASMAGCSKSVEDQVKTWEGVQKKVTSLSAEYPNFKTVIDTENKTATANWDKTTKSGEKGEKQVEALGKAMERIKKLTGRLAEVKSKQESLSDNISKLGKMKILKSNSAKRSNAIDKANASYAKVNKAIFEAKPENYDAAMAVLDAQVSTLISANSSISSTIRNVKIKKAKKKKRRKKRK